jgi:hypothetical protein
VAGFVVVVGVIAGIAGSTIPGAAGKTGSIGGIGAGLTTPGGAGTAGSTGTATAGGITGAGAGACRSLEGQSVKGSN